MSVLITLKIRERFRADDDAGLSALKIGGNDTKT